MTDRSPSHIGLPNQASDVMTAVGLALLLVGVGAIINLLEHFAAVAVATPLIAALAWRGAAIFARNPRMQITPMVLAAAYGTAVAAFAYNLFLRQDIDDHYAIIASFLIATTAMIIWYRRFGVPFSAFLTGIFALAAFYSAEPPIPFLLISSVALLVALWFDTRTTPGPHAETAFWFYLLAAPLLVTQPLGTLYSSDGTRGMGSLVVTLAAITLLALITNRRSFLAAAAACTAYGLVGIIEYNFNYAQRAINLTLLGAFATVLAVWWHPIRTALMRALPDFPGKSRLPPYGPTA